MDSPFIVRAPCLRARHDADAILAEARREAGRLRAEAEAEAARCIDVARAQAAAALEEARARGLDEGAAGAAALMTRAAEAVERFLRERDDEMRDVALAVAHRVLATLPRDELTLRLAAEAVAEHGRDVRLILKAAPETADRLRAALGSLPSGERVSVDADPALGPGDCTLLHPQGRTDIGLLAQFRAMMGTDAGRRPGGVP